MAKEITKESTFEEIGNLVAVKLLGQFMDGRMNVDEYRSVSRGLNGLFERLHVDQVIYENSGKTPGENFSKPTAPRVSKSQNERVGNFVNIMA